MATYITADLFNELENELSIITTAANNLRLISSEILSAQPQPDKWSVLQVLEHLNSYNRYYLPAIEHSINIAELTKQYNSPSYSSGWLGDYFVKTMYSQIKQNNSIANKMNAPKEHRPTHKLDAQNVLTEFMNGTKQLELLLQRAKGITIETTKTPISIAKWLTIRLGDTFRFLIAHKTRHFLQIKNTLASVQK